MRYQRQDHHKNNNEINRNLMFIQQIKLSGVNRLLIFDIHSQATLKNCENTSIRV